MVSAIRIIKIFQGCVVFLNLPLKTHENNIFRYLFKNTGYWDCVLLLIDFQPIYS
jgi:hypothetical protein